MNRWYHFLLLAFLSGILLTFSWPANGFPFLIFIAFVPLLYIGHRLNIINESRKKLQYMSHVYLALFIWNLLTTYWIYFSSPEGAYVAIIVNALMMTMVWMFGDKAMEVLGKQRGYIALITAWIAFEFFHHRWDLSWPWLTLGNVFANRPEIIQWYEYTGTPGGTLWILLVNILIFESILRISKSHPYKFIVTATTLILLLPAGLSYLRYITYTEKVNPVNVVLVQPNVDPWDKFSKSPADQFTDILRLIQPKVDSLTDYVITPETSIYPHGVWHHEILETPEYRILKSITDKYPHLNFISGISHLQLYQTDEEIPSTAEKFREKELYYDDHNSAIQIDKRAGFQLYHKSKLVPGPETLPFAEILKPIQGQLFGSLGGQIGDMGTQDIRTVFSHSTRNIKAAPVICYESIYGEFVSEYVINGANFISVSTNDAWWGNTPGYKQLLAYARLRAIENRRSVARAANTGISCFINQRGDIIQPSLYNQQEAIKGTINANETITLYTKSGDFIARISGMIAVMLIIFVYVKGFLKRKNAL